jgi:tRNA pseudouridine38-40 synthase
MPRYKLTIEYNGTGLAGWQRQDDRESVQSLLEKAAEKLAGHACDVVGAGRTDAGVHAIAQVAHFDMSRDISGYNVMHGMNYHLGPLTSQVIVTQAQPAGDDFHARFSAIRRAYYYRIVNRQARLAIDLNRAWHVPEKLDAQAMHAAAQLLVGHHDFTSFRSSECQSKSPLKTLERLDVTQQGDEIRIHAEARSFLHHQVRNMAGALRLIGNGKWTARELQNALEGKNRSHGGETAPASGLYLMLVGYGA